MSAAARRRKRAHRRAEKRIQDTLNTDQKGYAHARAVEEILSKQLYKNRQVFAGILCPSHLNQWTATTQRKPPRWHALKLLEAMLLCACDNDTTACPNRGEWRSTAYLPHKAEQVAHAIHPQTAPELVAYIHMLQDLNDTRVAPESVRGQMRAQIRRYVRGAIVGNYSNY